MKKRSRASRPTQANLRAELARIEAERTNIIRQLHGSSSSHISPRVPLWTIIKDHLQQNGGTDTVENIVHAMQDAGHNLGKYPLRTVKSCITSPSLRSVFPITTAVRKGVTVETVTLRSTEGRIHYAPEALRQQATIKASPRQ